MLSKMKILLKEKICSLFKKDLHHDGESAKNQKLMNKQKNPNQSFNGNKNNKQTKLAFSIA